MAPSQPMLSSFRCRSQPWTSSARTSRRGMGVRAALPSPVGLRPLDVALGHRGRPEDGLRGPPAHFRPKADRLTCWVSEGRACLLEDVHGLAARRLQQLRVAQSLTHRQRAFASRLRRLGAPVGRSSSFMAFSSARDAHVQRRGWPGRRCAPEGPRPVRVNAFGGLKAPAKAWGAAARFFL
jgi:hypothetical protein